MTWWSMGRLSLAKGEGEGGVKANQRGRSTNPTPHLHPLRFSEGRGDKTTPHELILILIDLQMMSLAAKRTSLLVPGAIG